MRPSLALGTVQFGQPYGVCNKHGQVSLKTVRKMLNYAIDNGFDTVDTAVGYGESEKVLGQIGVDRFNVISKLLPMNQSQANISEWVYEEVRSSISRLRINNLDGLLLHRSSDLHGSEGMKLYAAIEKLKCEGLIKKFGISIYSPSELDLLALKFKFDIVQSPFNVIDQRLHTSGWLKRLKDKGCEVHVRSIFLQGLLLLQRKSIPQKFERWCELWDSWHQWLKQHNMKALRTCISFPLSFSEIDRVIVGANNLAQLKKIYYEANKADNSKYPQLNFSDENLINPSNWNLI